jgi:hypothetical protein
MKRRNIGCGIVREYGIVSCKNCCNDNKGNWNVEVEGTYYRSATISCPTKKEALALGRMISRRINAQRKRRKRP